MNINALISSAISADRFKTYLDARAQDARRAFSLYEWNARTCASFYVPIQIIEVTLRNAFHDELAVTFGPDWPILPIVRGIDLSLHRKITEAEIQVKRGKRAVTVPRTVAAMPLGAWTTMMSAHLEHSLWTPALHRAFPGYRVSNGRVIARGLAAQRFTDVRFFRNRVAHHEPIFARNLAKSLQTLHQTASWFNSDVEAWIVSESAACQSLVKAGPPA